MNNQLLAIKAKCPGNEQFIFSGQDMFLKIEITNISSAAIGYPLAYLQKTGPVIHLVDTRTKVDTYLKTNLADQNLKGDFTEILPGRSATLKWAITTGEITQFGGSEIGLSAEITLAAKIQVEGKILESFNADTIRITGKML